MITELTTLLPKDRVNAFRRDYFLRVATVAVLLLAVIVFIGGALLMPSYLYERQTADAEAKTLQHLSASLASTVEQQVKTETKAVSAKNAAIQTLSNSATAGSALRAVLAVPRPGIILKGLTFTPPGSGPGSMQLTGVASTRESLRGYDAALAALPYVSNADLPISNYAQESTIKFTITLTGSLKP